VSKVEVLEKERVAVWNLPVASEESIAYENNGVMVLLPVAEGLLEDPKPKGVHLLDNKFVLPEDIDSGTGAFNRDAAECTDAGLYVLAFQFDLPKPKKWWEGIGNLLNALEGSWDEVSNCMQGYLTDYVAHTRLSIEHIPHWAIDPARAQSDRSAIQRITPRSIPQGMSTISSDFVDFSRATYRHHVLPDEPVRFRASRFPVTMLPSCMPSRARIYDGLCDRGPRDPHLFDH
jgi:hypothetical protein